MISHEGTVPHAGSARKVLLEMGVSSETALKGMSDAEIWDLLKRFSTPCIKPFRRYWSV